MRRCAILLLAFAAAGCGSLKDAFSTHPAEAARAGDQLLTVERLAELAARVKGMPLQGDNLTRLADVWIDYALFGQALAVGQRFDDTATLTRTMWPAISQLRWDRFHERLVSGRGTLTVAQVDSAYRAGSVRLFQHILIAVPPSAAPTIAQQKENQANGLLGQLHAGGSFASLAQRYSEDPGSKTRGGLLAVGGRGQFVPPFEDASWQLAPGGMTGLVRSSFGYHIIRRPPLAEVRDSFARGLKDMLGGTQDSLYLSDLETRSAVKVVSGAVGAVRQAAQAPDPARKSGRVLVDYRGGAFRVRDFMHWLPALDPRVLSALSTATEQQVEGLLKGLAQRDILLHQADSARVGLSDSDWAMVRAQQDSALTTVEGLLKLTPALLRDSVTTPEGRARLAMTRVNDYVDRVVGGEAQFAPLPPYLSEYLRAHGSWEKNDAGVQLAIERAQAIRAQLDSLRPTPRPNNQPVPTIPPGAQPITPRRRTLR